MTNNADMMCKDMLDRDGKVFVILSLFYCLISPYKQNMHIKLKNDEAREPKEAWLLNRTTLKCYLVNI